MTAVGLTLLSMCTANGQMMVLGAASGIVIFWSLIWVALIASYQR